MASKWKSIEGRGEEGGGGQVDWSHLSSRVSSRPCMSFMFHWNGTARGFIKIYELNHHWKYKTLVRAREGGGGVEERAGVERQWGGGRERQTNLACLCRMVGRKKKKGTAQCLCACVRVSAWTQSEETSRVQSIPSPLTSHLEAVIERKSAKVRVRQR